MVHFWKNRRLVKNYQIVLGKMNKILISIGDQLQEVVGVGGFLITQINKKFCTKAQELEFYTMPHKSQ